jgi:hypothetical protein
MAKFIHYIVLIVFHFFNRKYKTPFYPGAWVKTAIW